LPFHSGALAQPWSIIGSYLCAAVVALLVARVLGRTLGSACLAAGMTVILICWLRCLHRRGRPGDDAGTGRSGLGGASAGEELPVVMLGAGALLTCALAYNNATRTRYPKGASESPTAIFKDARAARDPAITAADLKLALAEMEQFYDVEPNELEQLIHAAETHARRRSIGEVLASRVN